ncbi:16S rRNA (guanine(966)-N(2))-methyltransferase RsmD [Salinicola rhizosphaerae]|uniref:Ribosomal RNA small subunit methyltransferase D n=1 Tax=Salinicola rhizosphaerae TaxID=1443141 RepID=A0ABQ3E4W3_9GAMM|nr:16S rRNA (guanine(966)-N(2))-methyltransferase RsmD [Salinicola rhizosphaerae]GHB19645.1 ribosomal RNA small subunit methyltransferase D [Salinicola rhizosphaerae]
MNRRRASARPRGADKGSGTSSGHTGSGQLRLIGGQYRRRKLPVAASPGLRPTPDRVRETLFNWLAFEVAGRRVLDLYAGTGALGLEALSRGAAEAVFVESTPPVARAIENNVSTLGANGRVSTLAALDYLQGPASPFDLVFLDPPFRQGLVAPTCDALERRGWLASDAWIYVEHEHELTWTPPARWHRHREIRAGDSQGVLFMRQPAEASPGAGHDG